jgi:hypothetical protein
MIAVRPTRALPPPDAKAIVWQPAHWYARPDLLHATPWWARIALPCRIPVLVRGPRSARARLSGGATAALLCIVWGCLIGGTAGATAGTLIVPLLGTVYGGLVGAPIGAVVGATWAPLTVAVLALRHRDVAVPHAALPDIARIFGVLPVLLGLTGAAIVIAFLASGSPLVAVWASAVVVGTMTVVIRLVRAAALAVSQAWSGPFGWQRA